MTLLARRPQFLANWLVFRNQLQRLVAPTYWTFGRSVLVGVAIAIIAAWCLNHGTQLNELLERAVKYWRSIIIVSFVATAILIVHRREAAKIRESRSWLATTVHGTESIQLAVLARSVIHPILWVLVVTSIALLEGLLSGSMSSAVNFVTAITIGFVAGALIGWYWPNTSKKSDQPNSRYVEQKWNRDYRAIDGTTRGLAHWPIAQALVWGKPNNIRLIALLALIIVPAGMGNELKILFAGAVFMYAVMLLGSATTIARAAARWLRSTPMTFTQFLWAMMRRPLLHEIMLCAAAIGALLLLGATFAQAAHVSLVLLAAMIMVSVIGVSEGYRHKPAGMRVAICLAAFFAMEGYKQGLSVPLSIAVIAWQLKRGVYV